MKHQITTPIPKYILLVFLTLFSLHLSAQDKVSITGKVTGIAGDPLIGVQVIVKGSSLGTVTDVDGIYKISNVDAKAIVSFTYVGMNPKHEVIAGRTLINVVLEESSKSLDEVVVIGYGESKRSDLTGSTKGIGSDQFASQGLQSAEQALVGRVSGAIVTQDNSPGGGLNIQIRGANSMSGGTQPLYVVDGFPIEPLTDARGNSTKGESVQQSSMNFINPNDIEDIQILKDASATAIYGARGANGVVLITTKSGKSGKGQVTYNYSNSVGTIAKKIDVMSSEEWADQQNQKVLNKFYIESEANRLGIWAGTPTPISLPYDGIKKPLPGQLPSTDWQNAIFQTALTQNHSLQFSGSSPETKYSISLGYLDQTGIVIGSDFKRYTFSSNLEQKFSKKFTISNSLYATRSVSDGASTSTGDGATFKSIVASAVQTQPIYSTSTNFNAVENTDPYVSMSGYMLDNPIKLAQLQVDKKINSSLTEALNFTYECNKYLKLFAKLGLNYTNSDRNQYWPQTLVRGQQNSGMATLSTQQTMKQLAEARINYGRDFGKHSLNLMGAYTYESNDFSSKYNTYAGFPDDVLGYNGINFATNHFPTELSLYNTKLISYISRVNYKFKDTYLLTGTLRADGSTRFAANKKWGVFPSVAAAWRVTQEEWIPQTEMLTNFKLRSSYGQTGSEGGISPYLSQGIQSGNNYVFNDVVTPGFYESNIKNSDLRWETTDQYNLGFDASLLKDHLLLTVDLYLKRTHDLLQWLTLPGSFGYTSKVVNMGEIDNKGLEFELTMPIVKTKNLNWKCSFNGSFNRNELVSLGDDRTYMAGSLINYQRVNRFVVGQPLGVFWGLQNDGIYRNWAEAQASGIFNALPGEVRYKNNYVDYQTNPDGTFVLDANGKKIPSKVQKINESDMTVIGDPNPKFRYGFNTSFQYKSFDISMVFSGQVGGQIYYSDVVGQISQLSNYNMPRFVANDAWVAPLVYSYNLNGQTITVGSATGNIDNATLPSAKNRNINIAGINQNYRGELMSSGALYDASFFKMTNISMGYNLKLPVYPIKAKITFGISNVFCITKYPGYDPEAASYVSSTTRKGIDIGSYPTQRSYNCSLSLMF